MIIKRSASLVALDFNTTIIKNKINITGEMVNAFVQLPANYVQTYGSRQFGGYIDIVGNVLNRKMFGWESEIKHWRTI